MLSRLKTSGRTGSEILVSHLSHHPCLCPLFAGEALGHLCCHILRVPVPKEHHLQNETGLHHKICHRNMKTEQGWLGLKKVQRRGITAVPKKPNPVDPVKDLHGVLDPSRKMWTPNYLGDECTKFPAPSIASAVGEDSIQPLVPGLSVGQEAAQLGPSIRHIRVVPCNKNVCACVAAPLYSGRCIDELRLIFSRLKNSAS